ncbi:hypothetical protein AB0C14_38070 [Microbispora hainanensis]
MDERHIEFVKAGRHIRISGAPLTTFADDIGAFFSGYLADLPG